MRRILRRQKLFLSLALIGELLVATPAPVSAGLFGGGGIKVPSASQMAAELENRYNLNLGSLRNQGQGLNVADQKKQAPETTLYFTPTDPKEGEKLTARAFPMFFTNTENSLYYTWYLKHAECDLTKSPSASARALCDRDDDGNITVEDWKIEAARIVAQNGFDKQDVSYSSDSDNDGYRARFGGDNKANTGDHCYVHDSLSGNNYELAENVAEADFGCAAGMTAICQVGSSNVTSDINDVLGGNEYFSVDDNDTCYLSGYPACSDSGEVSCSTGQPVCVADPNLSVCGTAGSLTTCSTLSQTAANPYCRHLFPNASGQTSGNGTFGVSEEEFWGTNPNDPDTADNGNKDEANVVGLGVTSLTWNYITGDKVGVAIEGTSLIPTKHNDSSNMIMWAFAKNDCPISLAEERGAYTTTIQGYRVRIPAADMDLNKCIAYLDGSGKEHELNLVDPTEGGQATNLEVTVSATPDAPVNDESGDRGGDRIAVQASVNNSDRGLNNILFDWKVEMSDNIRFLPAVGSTADITDDLVRLGALVNIRGNALDSIRLKMDLPDRAGVTFGGSRLGAYLNDDGIGYLRFSVRATENFSSGILRRGRSDIIIKFTSTGKKITASKAGTEMVDGKMRVRLSSGSVICNNDPLERNICPVVKNEIIGLRIDPDGLSNFQWSVNGQALTCTRSGVSPDCENEEQKEINFMPVSGNTGDTYTVSVAATDLATGAAVNLSRTFHVVEPQVFIESANAETAWPKLVGQYRDISGAAEGCPGGLCNDYSSTVFQALGGSELAFRVKFLPSFLESSAVEEWFLDNIPVEESEAGTIRFTANKPAPSIYNLNVAAQVVQSTETRRALFDIWNISPLETPEMNFSARNQIEVESNELAQEPLGGTKKALAALASYIPATFLFSFRILLSAVLIVFVTGFLFALIPPQSRLAGTRDKLGK